MQRLNVNSLVSWSMKKIMLLVFLFLFSIEISYARVVNKMFGDKSINHFTQNGYKITFVNYDDNFKKLVYTLEKDSDVVICYVAGVYTDCMKPWLNEKTFRDRGLVALCLNQALLKPEAG